MDSLLDAIIGGQHDDSLDAIEATVRERRKVLNARKRFDLAVGDLVRFNSQVSPKYLNGVTAKVTALGSGQKVTVELEQNRGRFRAGSPIGCPLAIIDKVA
jgi:hypothetical protein